MKPAVLVTGASGLLGAHLARRLVEEGYAVRLLLRSRRHPLLENLPADERRGELERPADVAHAIEGCSIVFHAAGLVSYRRADADALYRSNVLATRNVVRAALGARVSRLVHTSSTAAIGWSATPDRVLDESAVEPEDLPSIPYAGSKRLGEEEVLGGVCNGLDAVIVNPGTIFGWGDVHRRTAGSLRALRAGRLRAVPPGGFSVVSVEDAVEGHLLALDRGRSGRRYILAAENVTYREFFRRAADALGVTPPRRVLPRASERLLLPLARVAEVVWPAGPLSRASCAILYRYRFHDASRARSELAWQPRVALEEAAADAVRFFEEGGGADRPSPLASGERRSAPEPGRR
jgi:dihydroflavonol-4-reductase